MVIPNVKGLRDLWGLGTETFTICWNEGAVVLGCAPLTPVGTSTRTEYGHYTIHGPRTAVRAEGAIRKP